MKRALLISTLVLALAACGKTQPPNTVQQCGYDAQTNDTKCIYVPINQAQQAQQVQPQVVQQAPVQYAPAPQTVVVHDHDSGASAVTGLAAGMMLGHALSNSGPRYVEPSQTVVNKTIVNKTVVVNQAPSVAASTPTPAQPVAAPAPVAPAPIKSQTLTIPPKSYAPAPVVTPTYARPVQVSTPISRPSSSFTVSRPSSPSVSGFKRR